MTTVNLTLNEKQIFELAKMICAKNIHQNIHPKIQSIKDLRAITGFDLRTSKDIIWAVTPKNDDDLVNEVREILERPNRGF